VRKKKGDEPHSVKTGLGGQAKMTEISHNLRYCRPQKHPEKKSVSIKKEMKGRVGMSKRVGVGSSLTYQKKNSHLGKGITLEKQNEKIMMAWNPPGCLCVNR